jgi:hypothetical protein
MGGSDSEEGGRVMVGALATAVTYYHHYPHDDHDQWGPARRRHHGVGVCHFKLVSPSGLAK